MHVVMTNEYNNPSFATLELELEFVLRPTVSRPVGLGIRPPFGTLFQRALLKQDALTQYKACSYVVMTPREIRPKRSIAVPPPPVTVLTLDDGHIGRNV
jgi:hypothetical protein